jgi:hypothetical protein
MARKGIGRTAFLGLILGMIAALPGTASAKTARSSFVAKTVWQFDEPFRAGDFLWDDAGAPAGSVRVVVDLDAEMLYVYRGGVEIGRSTILYGYDKKPTPTGIFPIMAKMKDHYSSTYGGAPMPNTLRLTRDGVSIHGSEVEEGYATHGCVGLPKEFAASLFAAVRVGDPVLITRGWLPKDLHHPAQPIQSAEARVGYEVEVDSDGSAVETVEEYSDDTAE